MPTAITGTGMKLGMNNPYRPEPDGPVRITWMRYQDGDWQIEFVDPMEIGLALVMDMAYDPMMRQCNLMIREKLL